MAAIVLARGLLTRAQLEDILKPEVLTRAAPFAVLTTIADE